MSTIRLSGMASGIDTDSIVQEMMKAESIKKDNLEKELEMLEWQKEVWEEVNTKIYEFYTKDLHKMKQQSTYMKNNATVSDSGIMQVTASTNATTGVHSFEVINLAKGSFLANNHNNVMDKDSNALDIEDSTPLSDLVDFTGASEEDGVKFITFKISGELDDADNPIYPKNDDGTDKEIKIYETDTVASLANKINEYDADVKASFDSEFNSFSLSSEKTGEDSKVQFDFGGDAKSQALFTNLGFESFTAFKGEDCEFKYNGQTETFKSSDNSLTFNGMEISFTGENPGEAVSVVIEQDSDAVYNEIKDFVNSYNELILYFNEKVYADSTDGYEPLTDEEKEAMTDDQVKSWENKIKDSLLRRDDTLMSLTSYVRDTLTKDNSSSGSIFESLSQLGVVTGEYTERGLLHIEGDEDDPLYAVKENKLKVAIESDPEEVSKLFSKIAEDMYTELTERMASTKISSAFKIYNDKQIDDDIDDQKEAITKMEDYLITIENRYYSQFTAMEQVIAQMNQQSASLTSMLGG